MPSNIILIGPERVGKTTISKLLAEKLEQPIFSMRQTLSDDFKEQGYVEDIANELFYTEGAFAYYRYEMPYYAGTIEKRLADSGSYIFDLDAPATVYEDTALLERVKKVLSNYQNVVLLLPSSDSEKSVEVLKERMLSPVEEWNKLNEFFVRHPSNQTLAKFTFYTKDKTPEETVQEIIEALKPDGSSNIVLIGPMFTGKSTIGNLLAKKLNMPQQPLDKWRWDYYKEIDYDAEKAAKIRAEEGGFALARYWSPFNAYGVERILADYHNCVIDFGAGHSVYEDEALLKRVQKALAPQKNVVLLLPSHDSEESNKILRDRSDAFYAKLHELNAFFVRHPSNRQLAKIIVYTEGKTPQETCDEILSLTKGR